MNIKRKAFIFGLIFLIVALLSITLLPVAIKKLTPYSFSEYLFSQIEFFLLFWCGCFYVYCSKYYKYQLLSIMGAFVLYFLFARYVHF